MIQLKGTPVKMYSTGDISIQNTPRSASNLSIDPNKSPAAPHIFEHLTGLIKELFLTKEPLLVIGAR